MAVNPFSLNKRIEFGHYDETLNENTGAKVKKFVKEFVRWGNIRSRTLKEFVQIEGTSLENTSSVVVRNSSKIKEQLVIRVDNQCYQIVTISYPNASLFSDYLFLSVKKIQKIGGSNG